MSRQSFFRISACALALGVAAACTTTVSPPATRSGVSEQRREISASVDLALNRLYAAVPGSRELVSKASGVVVFPSVIAAGFVVGAQYGKGALRVRSVDVAYYSLGSLSVGLQIGAQSKAVIVLLMTPEVLERFRKSNGWTAGIDGSVAILKVGANGVLDAATATGPILAFVQTNAGLMANVTLEGTKITRLDL